MIDYGRETHLCGKKWYYRLTLADGRRVTAQGMHGQASDGADWPPPPNRTGRRKSGPDWWTPKELAYRDHQAPTAGGTPDRLGGIPQEPRERRPSISSYRPAALVESWRSSGVPGWPTSTRRRTRSGPSLPRYEATLAEWVAPARLSDLTAERVQKALATLRAEGRSLATCNHYRTAVKAFSEVVPRCPPDPGRWPPRGQRLQRQGRPPARSPDHQSWMSCNGSSRLRSEARWSWG